MTVTATPVLAWDAAGHRMITRLALEGMRAKLGTEAPGWLLDSTSVKMVADQAVTPDRWRSDKTPQLTHLNNPDHYVDIEQLAEFGLTLRTVPPLRHEFVRVMSLAREKPGFTGKPINERRDPARVQEYPGFLPHATLENYGKIVSAMRVVRVLERLDDPARAHQLEMARASVRYSMGIMAHYVGDAAQPLHTTIHHHGWVGENPKGYSTDNGIHSYIDGGVIRAHRITADDVRPKCKFEERETSPTGASAAWEAVLSELERSFAQMEPLYQLHKAGEFERESGKAFIEERLADGAMTLAGLYAAAWRESTPTQKDVDEFLRYDGVPE
ncbi:MAG: nuclease [Phycisphaerae bacterium]|nr:MAG: nuclease [Phycisphaerae bacterium]